MKSQTLSQFQNSMYELNGLSTFGRGKDKTKRKSRGNGNLGKTVGSTAMVGGALGAGSGAVALDKVSKTAKTTGINLAKESNRVTEKSFRNAVNGLRTPEQSKKIAANLSKMAKDRLAVGKLAGKGKVAAGLAAGGLLAGAAVNALRKNKKKKR